MRLDVNRRERKAVGPTEEQEAVEVLLPCYKRHMDLHRLEDGFSLMGLLPSSEAWWLRVQQLLLVMSSVDVFTDTYFASTMGLGGNVEKLKTCERAQKPLAVFQCATRTCQYSRS